MEASLEGTVPRVKLSARNLKFLDIQGSFGLCFVFSYVVSLHIIFSLDLILILAKGSLL